MNEKQLRNLYNDLSQKYDLGDYGTFAQLMQRSEQRRNLYNDVSKDYDLGSFEEYERILGVATQKPLAPFMGGKPLIHGATALNEQKLRALYEGLSQSYDLGDYGTFAQKMQNADKRKALYDTAAAEFDLGTFEEYESKLGITPESRLCSYQQPSELSPLGTNFNPNAEIRFRLDNSIEQEQRRINPSFGMEGTVAYSQSPKIINKEYLAWLHQTLQEGGYKVGTLDELRKGLKNPETGSWAYNALRELGWDAGTPEDFNKAFGLTTQEQAAREPQSLLSNIIDYGVVDPVAGIISGALQGVESAGLGIGYLVQRPFNTEEESTNWVARNKGVITPEAFMPPEEQNFGNQLWNGIGSFVPVILLMGVFVYIFRTRLLRFRNDVSRLNFSFMLIKYRRQIISFLTIFAFSIALVFLSESDKMLAWLGSVISGGYYFDYKEETIGNRLFLLFFILKSLSLSIVVYLALRFGKQFLNNYHKAKGTDTSE
jgi:hypothetical protein